MDLILKHRSSIYGLMALWIILFHIQGNASIPFPVGGRYASYLLDMGNTGVDVFMFLSAYCLSYGYKKYDTVTKFYKNRIKRLALPYLIIATPFVIWKNVNVVNAGLLDQLRMYVLDISGVSFITHGMDWTWFIFAIFLLYLLFPLLYKICSINFVYSCTIFIASYIFIFCIYEYVAETIVHHRFAIAYCRIPIFIAGIITYLYNDRLSSKNNRLLIPLLVSIFVYFMLSAMEHYANNMYNLLFDGKIWLVYLPRVIPICYICALIFNFIKEMHVLNLIGDASLEMYLWHILILNVLIYYNLHTSLLSWCYLLLPMGGVF